MWILEWKGWKLLLLSVSRVTSCPNQKSSSSSSRVECQQVFCQTPPRRTLDLLANRFVIDVVFGARLISPCWLNSLIRTQLLAWKHPRMFDNVMVISLDKNDNDDTAWSDENSFFESTRLVRSSSSWWTMLWPTVMFTTASFCSRLAMPHFRHRPPLFSIPRWTNWSTISSGMQHYLRVQ